jgi:putative heme-binding domain-containing protein
LTAIRKSTHFAKVLALSFVVLLSRGAIVFGQNRNRAASPPGAKADSASVQRAFAANCAGCHGLDGKGGERAPDVVTRPNVRKLTDAQLLQILQRGVPQTSMPAFGQLGDDVLRSLVAYLRSLQGSPATAALPGDIGRGKKLFFGKGACSDCHMIRGQGGFFASDLTTYARGRAPETIRDAIVLPNRDLDPRNRTVVVTLPDGKTFEGIARNEDNFSMQLLSQDGSLLLFSKSAVKSLSHRNQSPMPADYGTRLSATEIEDLVNFLNSVTKEDLKQTRDEEKDDGE